MNMTNDWFINKSREIADSGERIPRLYEIDDDGQVTFSSRRHLAEKIELALRQAWSKGKSE